MDNPYSSPTTVSADPTGAGPVTPGVIQALAATKPWVRLCSIIGFIGAGLMILFGGFMLIGGGVMMAGGGDQGMPFAGFPIVMALFYIVLALFYLFPSIKLWKYGSHILALMSSNSAADLEAALDSQRSFWKFVGILVLVMIALYVIGIAVMAIFFVAIGTSGAFGP